MSQVSCLGPGNVTLGHWQALDDNDGVALRQRRCRLVDLLTLWESAYAP